MQLFIQYHQKLLICVAVLLVAAITSFGVLLVVHSSVQADTGAFQDDVAHEEASDDETLAPTQQRKDNDPTGNESLQVDTTDGSDDQSSSLLSSSPNTPAESRTATEDHDAAPRDSAPIVYTSQFAAHGCQRTGTAALQIDGQTVHWDVYRQLANGDRGDCVRSIQRKMNSTCQRHLEVDGIYGPKTAQAVRDFQQSMRQKGVRVNDKSIYVDGITGPQTYALMHQFRHASC